MKMGPETPSAESNADKIIVVNFKPKSFWEGIERILRLHSDEIADKPGVIRVDQESSYVVRTERHDFRLYENQNYPYHCWASMEGHKYRVIVTDTQDYPSIIASKLEDSFEESIILHDSVLEHFRKKKLAKGGKKQNVH